MTPTDFQNQKPWPIKLLNKLGVTNELLANRIVVAASIIILAVAIYLYMNNVTPEVRELSPEELKMFSQ